MQRVIFDYAVRKTDISGTPAFATQYSDVMKDRQIVDNAVEVASGNISLPVASPFLSAFTAANANYLQLISTSPFYIKITISGVQTNLWATSAFSYSNPTTPIESIELYNGTAVYDSVTGTFSADGGTVAQTITYVMLKF